MQPTLNIALRAARAAVEKLNFDLEQKPTILENGASLKEFVELAIDGAGSRLIKAIRKSHPDHNIEIIGSGTDEARNPDTEVLWRVKIIDGVANYLTGYPMVMIAVSFSIKDKIQHIALVNPFTGDEYICSRGRGMHFAEKRIRVTNVKKLPQTLISSFQFDPTDVRFASLQENQVHVRATGSFLTDVAHCCAGKCDATIAQKVDGFDLELASLMAQESGALTGSSNGKPLNAGSSDFVMANPKLYKQLVQALNN